MSRGAFRVPAEGVTAQGAPWPQIALQAVGSGFRQPTTIANAGDGSGRLFVLEQRGRIRVLAAGATGTFLDISDRVSCCIERGLLGLAFPPGYATKGRFYVHYTNLAGNVVIARYRVSADPNVADPASEEILLTIDHPYANHNGGQLAFGPRDGYLYIGVGDGGSEEDPHNYGQNPGVLLGKILRIDVEGGTMPYAVPPDNPFVSRPGYRPEIWALGLRNPWRFSFDRETGDLYIADVGQDRYEEVDFQPASSRGGENYGWRIMEGLHCFNPDPCDPAGLVQPVAEYDHALGCSITGGYVYRGPDVALRGVYYYGDYCSGRMWGLRQENGAWQNTQLLKSPYPISTFGEDEAGNVYLADYAGGRIYQLTSQ